MFCRKCGNPIPEGAKYCKKCGTKVMQKATDIESGEKRMINDTDENSNSSKKPKRKKKKRWFLWFVAFLLLLCVMYCVLMRFFHVGIWVPRDADTITDIENDHDMEADVETVAGPVKIYELDQASVKYDEDADIHYVNNMIIAFFSPSASKGDIDEVVTYLSGQVVGSIPAINQYQIQVPECSYSELNILCSEIEGFECVESASIDEAVKLRENVIPEDPWKKKLLFFGEKWDEDHPRGSNWWQEAINAPGAWEYDDYYENIKIGIVDGGFDTQHEDLLGRIKFTTGNNDAQRHGTHVAGIIGAIPNNKCGITGVVWNGDIYTTDWELSKEQSEEERYSTWKSKSQIYGGVSELITNKGVKVVNLSLGLKLEKKEDETDAFIQREGEIASYYLARLLRCGYDFMIVQSAGNGDKDGNSIDARYNGLFCSITEDNCLTVEGVSKSDVLDRVIIVGAAKNDERANFTQAAFSNAGPNVDICAPGEDVYSTVPGGYDSLSGTSMAAPIVTGVVSLVWSVDPELSGAEVKHIVCSVDNTKYVVRDNTSKRHPLTDTYRLVNAQLAVEAALAGKEEREGEDSPDRNPEASGGEINAEPLHFSGAVRKPEDVVLKMYDALQKGDYETAAECLDPETEQQIDFWGGIASSIVELFTGEYMSWGQLVLEAAGATDVEVIECHSYHMEYRSNMDIFSELSKLFPQIEGLKNALCTDADVYVKYRYKYNDKTYIEEESCHVKRYEWSGWRIEKENK